MDRDGDDEGGYSPGPPAAGRRDSGHRNISEIIAILDPAFAESFLTEEDFRSEFAIRKRLLDEIVYSAWYQSPKNIANAKHEQGFDPKVILREMTVRRTDYVKKESVQEWDLGNLDGKCQVTPDTRPDMLFSNHSSVLVDARFLIQMVYMRGSRKGKFLKKIPKGLNPVVEMLKMKYDLKDKEKGTFAAQNITIPRIARTFPNIACDVFRDGIGKSVIPMPSLGLSEDDSTVITCSAFASMIPKSRDSLPFVYISLYKAVLLDDESNSKKKVTSLRDIWTCYQSSFHSPSMTAQDRASYIKTLGYTVQDTVEPHSRMRAAAVQCKSRLARVRPRDPDQGNILSWVDNFL